MDKPIVYKNYIYFKDIPKNFRVKVENDLTLTIKELDKIQDVKLYDVVNNYVGVPNQYLRNIQSDKDIYINIEENKIPEIDFRWELRPNQKDIMNKYLSGIDFDIPFNSTVDFKTGKNLILNNYKGIVATTGAGKTVLGSYVISQLRHKTLIVVHRDFLMEQWRDTLLNATSLTADRIGVIAGKTTDIQDVTIGMLQTLLQPRIDKELLSQFNLVIADEMHHLKAFWFNQILGKVAPVWFMGLTGTWEVSNKHIFQQWVQPIYMKTDNKDVMPFKYYKIDTGLRFPFIVPQGDGKDKMRYLRYIPVNKRRNDLIINYILRAYDKGRKILVLSERKKQLEYFKDELNKKRENSVSVFYGSGKVKEMMKGLDKNIVLATYQKAEEGLNREDFDVLVLATPKSDVRQAIGRVIRLSDKETPVILDFVDNDKYLLNLYRKRQSQYDELLMKIKG